AGSQLSVLVESYALSSSGVGTGRQRRACGERERFAAHLGEPGFGVDENPSGQLHITEAGRSGGGGSIARRSQGPVLSDHRNLHNQGQNVDRTIRNYWP